MFIKNGEGVREYKVIRNGVGEILLENKFGLDETANRCKMVAILNLEPGQCTGYHGHDDDCEVLYLLEGELICVEDGVEKIMKPGDCTATAYGEKHQIINRTDKIARALAIVMK